jgi:hypothetical protein
VRDAPIPNMDINSHHPFQLRFVDVFVVAIACVFVLWVNKSEGQRYPPGPKPSLIGGNIFRLPKKLAFKVLNDWKSTFGSSTIILPTCSLSYLNDRRSHIFPWIRSASPCAQFLLGRRRLIRRSPKDVLPRPRLTMAGELMGLEDVSIPQSQPSDQAN